MTYEEFVASVKKNPHLIDSSPFARDVQHMLMGLSGEVGELVDVFKKHFVYGQDLDLDHVAEELGDIEFFMEGLRQALYPYCGLTRDAIIKQNMHKLSTRYPEGYSDEHAAERADKKV